MKKLVGAARVLWLLAAALLGFGGALNAEEDYVKIIYIRVGDEPPPIELKDDHGNLWKSSQHYGKKYVVLYFYMGDFMNNCTREAISYRNDYAALVAQGAEVVGISGDVPANHRMFKEKYQLRQTLLSDDRAVVGKAFGSAWSGGGEWAIKDDAGNQISLRRGVTESRWTWIIGKDGRVLYKNTNADPEQDSKQVLKFLTDLNARQEQP